MKKRKRRDIRELLMQDETLSRYVLFKLRLKISSGLSDIAFINKLFKKLLGLKTKRRMVREGEGRHWRYQLSPAAFLQLKEYYDNGANQETKQEKFEHLSPGRVI